MQRSRSPVGVSRFGIASSCSSSAESMVFGSLRTLSVLPIQRSSARAPNCRGYAPIGGSKYLRMSSPSGAAGSRATLRPLYSAGPLPPNRASAAGAFSPSRSRRSSASRRSSSASCSRRRFPVLEVHGRRPLMRSGRWDRHRLGTRLVPGELAGWTADPRETADLQGFSWSAGSSSAHAAGGIRTHTPFRTGPFEGPASTVPPPPHAKAQVYVRPPRIRRAAGERRCGCQWRSWTGRGARARRSSPVRSRAWRR